MTRSLLLLALPVLAGCPPELTAEDQLVDVAETMGALHDALELAVEADGIDLQDTSQASASFAGGHTLSDPMGLQGSADLSWSVVHGFNEAEGSHEWDWVIEITDLSLTTDLSLYEGSASLEAREWLWDSQGRGDHLVGSVSIDGDSAVDVVYDAVWYGDIYTVIGSIGRYEVDYQNPAANPP